MRSKGLTHNKDFVLRESTDLKEVGAVKSRLFVNRSETAGL